MVSFMYEVVKEEDDIECLGDSQTITSIPAVPTESNATSVDDLYTDRGITLTKDTDVPKDDPENDPNAEMIESIAHQILKVKIHFFHMLKSDKFLG